MPYLKNYLLLCFWGLLLHNIVAQSVSSNVEDRALSDLKTSKLATYNLLNYQEQAILQLQDMLDYISIIGSNKYNIGMRQTALETVLTNFDKKSKIQCNWMTTESLGSTEKPTCTPTQTLEKLLQSSNFEFALHYENLKAEKELTLQKDGSYLGTLSYQQIINLKKEEKSTQHSSSTKKNISLNYILKRTKKQFGNEQELIWEVQFLDTN